MQHFGSTSHIQRLFENSSDLDWLYDLSLSEWGLLIQEARETKLLGRLALLTTENLDSRRIPAKVAMHLASGALKAEAHRRGCSFEVSQIYRILSSEKIEFCLLKGVAYLHAGIDTGRGRLFGDIDILVRKQDLDRAERVLCDNKWVPTKIDPYSQNYYRQWSHELPPLHHTQRHSDLDVHHTVVPPIIKTRFEIQRFWDDAVQDPKLPGLYQLARRDRILHSAAHLFQEGQFNTGFRDLIDLDSLFRDYLDCDDSWQSLLERAELLDLKQHLWFSLKLCSKLLHTPIPKWVLNDRKMTSHAENVRLSTMLWLYEHALPPDIEQYRLRFSQVSRLILFIRSHYIRMPLGLLLPHLWRKAFVEDH